MGIVTLQMIFHDAYPLYEQTHPLSSHVRRAARAIMQCRTAALGGHVQACPDGHVSRIWYNSCRHRSCPQCAYLQTERWLALQQARLLACDHYHVIFTLPHALNPLWLANVPVMTTLLFQAVRDTLNTLLADPKYLGAQPGIIAALGIRLRRDSLVSVMYAEELNSTTSSVTLQRTDRHGILGQKSSHCQMSL
jgi:hypothetical protein